MHWQLNMLLSDWIICALFFVVILFFFYSRKRRLLRDSMRQLFQRKLAMISAVILAFYVVAGLLDSVHFNVTTHADGSYPVTQIKSLLDLLVSPLGEQDERTYSAPFATHSYSMEFGPSNGQNVREYPSLMYGGAHLQPTMGRGGDILKRVVLGFVCASISFLFMVIMGIVVVSIRYRQKFVFSVKRLFSGETLWAWREGLITFWVIWILIWIIGFLAAHYHIFGTNKVGGDVFYETLKSIRTGLLIGTLTSLFMLPFALFLGMLAGFFSGWIDDLIQYLYTTLSSIPGVLLIAASVLVMQVFIANHAEHFSTLAQRADARLLALCFILGITSWASLCRFLRGETLKLREQEFVDAARVMGIGSWKILLRHIMPNVMHIVLITMVLDFSGLVLAEAVLSYVGVGVDPTTFSWGNMINSSRLELAREPIVWWPLLAALVFMFVLVLAANVFADAVRDSLDPRLRETEGK